MGNPNPRPADWLLSEALPLMVGLSVSTVMADAILIVGGVVSLRLAVGRVGFRLVKMFARISCLLGLSELAGR